MDKQQQITHAIQRGGLLPLFYNDDAETCLQLMQLCYDSGIRCIEFTNRGEKALQNFHLLVQKKKENMPGLFLGVGTIKTDTDTTNFIDAGADFLVSPFFDNAVCDAAYLNKTLWIPGCMTPKEIHIAEQAGCELIKLFPGNTLQPEFITAVQPLFPKISFMVTGGVDAGKENLSHWFKCGAAAVGMGSKLFNSTHIKEKNWKELFMQVEYIFQTIISIKRGLKQ